MRDFSVWQRGALRSGILSGFLVTTLVVFGGATPHAAAASTMQLHGALHRDGSVGIISHRGAAALAPENTLAAMRVAIDQNVEFVEADVQLTADGVPVLIHDPTLERTTNGIGLVSTQSFDAIRQLDAGSWFDPAFAGEQIPTLEEFLDLLEPSTTRALVELKHEWTTEQISNVVELLRERHLVNRVALQSFEPEALEVLREVAPEFARVMLTREWTDRTVAEAARLQASAVGARTKLFDERPELITEAQALGIGTMAYTLNSEKKWVQAADRGIDLVITDDPVALAEWRG